MADQRLTTLSDYLGVLRRRIWILIVAVVVAVAAAYFVSSRETPAYRAEAQVQYGSNSIQGVFNPGAKVSSSVLASEVATAAQNAHTTTVASLTLHATGITALTPQQLLHETTITPSSTSSVITFDVTDRSPDRAKTLATTYAQQYVKWSNAKAIKGIQSHIAADARKIRSLNDQIAAQGGKGNGTASVQGLVAQLNAAQKDKGQWETAFQSLQNGNSVTQTATTSSKVRPLTARNMAMGFGLGIVIGLVLVSLAEALDTRVRSSDEVAQRLGLSLLTRIPIPPRSLRKAGSLGMLDDEGGVQSEAYRKLRINLDFANLQMKARTIMVTSAIEQEGKSTTVANLAVALARAGRRVILVDLDLRKPYLDHFFELTGKPGLTDVALGNVTLDQAMWSIPIPGSAGGPDAGSLHVLPSGPMPPNPADLIESTVVSEILLDVAERADVVLLDSAPLLPVSDSVVLSNKVDAMLVVVRAATVRRPMLAELQRVLAACPATPLGFVLTGADESGGYGYGYGYGGYGQSRPVVQPPAAPYEGSGNGANAPDGTQAPTKSR